MTRLWRAWITAMVLAVLAGSAPAQQAPQTPADQKPQPQAATQPQPAGAPAQATTGPKPPEAPPDDQAQPLTVTVKAVSGTAHKLLAGPPPKWEPLKVGEKLDETTVIRTGLRSKVVLAFADNSTVTVNRATKMGIAEFRKQGKVTKTKLGLKYGSMRATVEKARGPNDFTVATPVATTAVTGTGLATGFTGDIGMRTNCNRGGLRVSQGFKVRNLLPGQTTNHLMTRPLSLMRQSFMAMLGDAFGGTTPIERRSLTNLGGGRGIIGFVGSGEGTRNIIKPPPVCLRSNISSEINNSLNHSYEE